MNKYAREITQTLADEDQGFTISVDVYDVLRAFNVTDPAIQHAIKKLLCTGIRGHKDSRQDLEEAVQSIERALDVVKTDEKLAEAMAESQPVTSDNPQQSPACPFKVGDVVTHFDQNTSKTKWKITHIQDGKLLVTSHDPYQTPSWIEQVFWCNYRVVEQVETAAREPQPCPFKVGDVIQSIRWSDYIFRVYEIRGDIMEADSVTSGSRFEIPRDHWGGYRLKSDFGVDKPAATC
jgi:hypothetical protein